MANSFGKIKKTKYTKKTRAGVYDVYHFETDDNQVLLDEAVGNIAKGTTLHDALTKIKGTADTGGQVAKDLAAHVARTDNPHQVTKDQVKLGNVVNAKMDDAPTANSNNYVKSGGVYTAVSEAKTAAGNAQSKADAAYDLANGRTRAFVFSDVTGLTSGTKSDKTAISGYKVGDNIYIVAKGVADFWISAIGTTGTASSADVIKNAKAGASVVVKWGSSYVTLTAVEDKEDLSNYSTTQQIADKYRTKADSLSADETRQQISNAKTELTETKTTLTGDVNAEFTNAGGKITATLPDTGVTAGTYSCVSVDAKGRVTAGALSLAFASSIDDPSLNNLADGGVAIIEQ